MFLELSNFCSSLDGIWTHTIDTLQHHSLSLTSSALDLSTTSTPYIYIYCLDPLVSMLLKNLINYLAFNCYKIIIWPFQGSNIYKLAENYAQIVCPFSCDVMDITLIAKRKKTNNFSIRKWLIYDWFIVFNATFSNISAISWRPVLVVKEAVVPRENYRPWASNW